AVVARRLAQALPDAVLVGEEDADSLRTEADRPTLEQVCHFVRSCCDGASEDDICDWIDHGNGEPGREFWTLDPVDGTKGFLRGDQYAVALAWIRDGRVELGVLGCPGLVDGTKADVDGKGSLLVAQRGHGTWVTPLDEEGAWKQLRVSASDDP